MQPATLLLGLAPAARSRSIHVLLEAEYHVVGEVHDARAVAAALEELDPALLLLDLALPGRSGPDLLLEVLLRPRPPAVVGLAARVDRPLAEYVLGRDRNVLLAPDAGPAELRAALEAARAGRGFMAPRVAWAEPDPGRLPPAYRQLTLREQQVVQMIGLGLKNEGIARHLQVSYRTVHFHRSNIRRKLDFHSDWEMARFALHVRECAAGERRGRPV
jgi:DNA-binding NarL/FixJ family response regulator